MISCTPTSLFKWNFRLTAPEMTPIETVFDVRKEEGSITIGGEVYSLKKRSGGVINKGIWQLMVGDHVHAEGENTAVIVSTWEIRVPGMPVIVGKAAPFSRIYVYSINGHEVGRITPDHILTRASKMKFNSEVPELTQIFCFWLAIVHWYEASSD